MCVSGCREAVMDHLSRRTLFKGVGAAALAALAAPARPARAETRSFSRAVDLTHTLSPDFPTFSGTPGIAVEEIATHEKDGYRALRWNLAEHSGTHLDAPVHFGPGAPAADALPVEALVVPLAVVDIRARAADNADAELTPDDIREWQARFGPIPDGACVAMNSGWDRHADGDRFRNADSGGVMHFPGFHVEASHYLMEETKALGIAVDTLSLDRGASTEFGTHRTWLPSNRWGMECVARLGDVPQSGATLIAGAPKIAGATGGPSRVIALV